MFLAPPPRPDYRAAANILRDLPDLLKAARGRLGINLSTQARQMGIAASTMTGLNAGRSPSFATVLAALAWLDAH